MAYRINGVVRINDSGDVNAGIVTATLLDGPVSAAAITGQTEGSESDVTGADEILIYDQATGDLLRVTVDEFVAGSGIGTLVTEFENLSVTGVSTLNGAVSLGSSLTVPDGESIFLGDSGDLQITHSGSNSLFIDNGTGNLIYRSGTQILQNRLGTKTSATFNTASSVDLSFDDETKFRTASDGIRVAGVVTALSGVVTYYGDGSGLTDIPDKGLRYTFSTNNSQNNAEPGTMRINGAQTIITFNRIDADGNDNITYFENMVDDDLYQGTIEWEGSFFEFVGLANTNPVGAAASVYSFNSSVTRGLGVDNAVVEPPNNEPVHVTLTKVATVAGATGPQGDTGATGPDGATGLTGATGTNSGTEVGTVVAFAATTAPDGWLECDGSTISRATFSDLFDVIGETYGAGDGTTTFVIPDLRAEFIRGWDNNAGIDTGRVFGSNQDDEVGPHVHDYRQRDRDGGGTAGTTGNTAGNLDPVVTGISTGYETRPRNVALLYCIKYVANDIGAIGATGLTGATGPSGGPQGATGATGPGITTEENSTSLSVTSDSGGTFTITDNSRYIKIDNMVNLYLDLTIDTLTGEGGGLLISGLPYDCRSGQTFAGSVLISEVTLSQSDNLRDLMVRFTIGGTDDRGTLTIVQNTGGNNPNLGLVVDATSFSDGARFVGTLSYLV